MEDKEKENAANCIKEILESYIEFIEIVQNDSPVVVNIVANKKYKDWKPMLDKVNSDLEFLKESK